MKNGFRDAFLWHLDRHDGTLIDIARKSGVSRDTLNKLIARENSSTNVENAIAIARYFGKTLEQFIACDAVKEPDRLPALTRLLSDEEKRLVEAMVRGVLAERGKK